MTDLTSLVEFYKSFGFSPKEALEKAEAKEALDKEKERACELICSSIVFLLN